LATNRTRSTFGRLFRRKDRQGYYVRVRFKGRELVRFAGFDRRTASEYLAKLSRAVIREDILGDRNIESLTFTQYQPILEQALRARHAPSTFTSESGRLKRVVEWFGPAPIKDIGPGEIQDFLTQLRSDHEFTTAATNRYAALLSVAFKLAVQKGYARKNPVKDIVRSREAQRAVPFVSADDVAKLVAEARDPRFGALLRVLGDTGLRRSEALALEWRDVDLRRGCALVRESKSKRPRQVELTAAALAAFRWLGERREATPIKGPDLVWPEWTERLPSVVSARFTVIAKRAGLEGLRLHDLRHGFCSRLAQAGVPLPTIAALAGHTSFLTTQRYASHLPTGATRGAIQALERNESAPTKERGTAS
jgi:integrase